jgi:hypothetical protein
MYLRIIPLLKSKYFDNYIEFIPLLTTDLLNSSKICYYSLIYCIHDHCSLVVRV